MPVIFIKTCPNPKSRTKDVDCSRWSMGKHPGTLVLFFFLFKVELLGVTGIQCDETIKLNFESKINKKLWKTVFFLVHWKWLVENWFYSIRKG